MTALIRPPAVAGRFYPHEPDVLRTEVDSYLDSSSQRTSALGCIVPHGIYVLRPCCRCSLFRTQSSNRCILMLPQSYWRGPGALS